MSSWTYALFTLKIAAALAFAPLLTHLAAAQSSEVPLRHLNHTAWTMFDVPALHGAFDVVRSNDGYLWINARNGVLRFDGVRFELLDSIASPVLKVRRNEEVRPLLVDKERTLWLLRADRALLTYRDGEFRVATAPDTALPAIPRFAMDGAGHMFAYSASDDKLFRIHDGRASRVEFSSSIPRSGTSNITADTANGMWIGRRGGIWHIADGREEKLRIGQPQPGRFPLPLVQTRDGTLWATNVDASGGLKRIERGIMRTVRAADSSEIVDAYAAVEDSLGAVWISTHGHGVLRWSRGKLEGFTKRDGLTDAIVYGISVDGRGAAIMATASGLDRLRPTPFVTLDANDGVPVESPERVVRDASGSWWTAGIDGRVVAEFRASKTATGSDTIIAERARLANSDAYTVLGAARGGGVWIGTQSGAFFRYRNGNIDHRAQVRDFEGRSLTYVLEQANGDLWLGREQLQLELWRHDRFVKSPVEWASGVAEDSRGHVWIADAQKPELDEVVDGKVLRKIGQRDGLPGFVSSFVIEHDNLIWAMTDSGVARIADGTVSLVRTPAIDFLQRYGPDLTIVDDHLWFVSDSRVGRILLASLHAAADDAKAVAAVNDFGPNDGLAAPHRFVFRMSTVQRGADGRLWFASPAGLAVFNRARELPSRVSHVVIEEISAHGRSLFGSARGSIAANPDRVTIHYSAPNITMPERERLQYRLDDVDHNWIDGGPSRVATYTQLPPRAYVLHVRAWDVDTTIVPPRETLLNFRVDYAWYQLLWLRIAAVLLVVVTIAFAAVQWQRRRSRISTARLQAQFDVRLAERTRIARELHDTLLQGFTGLVLQLEGLRQTIGRAPVESVSDEMSRILSVADATLFDARQSVWDMRTPGLDEHGLVGAMEIACRELAEVDAIALTFVVTGLTQPLPSGIEAAALHVSREAMRNVVEHAGARNVHVEVRYAPERLFISLADDGHGMSHHQLEAASSKGHFGILGMRERAATAGGTLEIETNVGEGTRITLNLPCTSVSAAPTGMPITADDTPYRKTMTHPSTPSARHDRVR